jgi:Bacterial cadherin-like domain
MGRLICGRQQMLPLGRRPTGPTAADLRRVVLTVAVAGTAWLAFAADAGAVPTCPPQEVTTPYDTPVTVTLACIEPDPSLLPVTYHLPPGTTGVSISGDKATFTPVPGAVGPTSFNYLAANNMGTPGFGLVRVNVLPPPMPAPPPASPNRPPVAACEHYSVKPGGTLSVPRPGVLSNDSDPDGDGLRAVNKYTSNETFPLPFVAHDGSVKFAAPTKPRMLSYRYGVTDGILETTATLTIWVGMKDGGCRPAFDPPPRSRSREIPTLRRVGAQ